MARRGDVPEKACLAHLAASLRPFLESGDDARAVGSALPAEASRPRASERLMALLAPTFGQPTVVEARGEADDAYADGRIDEIDYTPKEEEPDDEQDDDDQEEPDAGEEAQDEEEEGKNEKGL